MASSGLGKILTLINVNALWCMSVGMSGSFMDTSTTLLSTEAVASASVAYQVGGLASS